MTAYLETGLSLILIFFIFSVVAYVIQELLAINLEYRGKFLYNALAHILEGKLLEGRKAINQIISGETPSEEKAEAKKQATENAVGGTTTDENSLTQVLYNHPQIQSLQRNLKRLPSYVPAANFALALLDTVAAKVPKTEGDLLARVRQGLTGFTKANGNIGTVLQNLVDSSTGLVDLQMKLENWYTEYMDRVTGWYKSHTLLTLRLVSLGVVLFFNLDVLSLGKKIFTDAHLREGLVQVAEHLADHPDVAQSYMNRRFNETADSLNAVYEPLFQDTSRNKDSLQSAKTEALSTAAERYSSGSRTTVDSLNKALLAAGLPLGWNRAFLDSFKEQEGADLFWKVVWLLLGWGIAVGSLSMGAPFWFDVLVKVVNIRRAGVKPSAGDSKRQ